MKKILYTAIDSEGKKQINYIETSSNEEAIDLLKSQGCSGIDLQTDAADSPIQNEFLENISNWQLKKMAQFELESRKDSSIFTLIKQSIIYNWLFISIGIIIITFGILQHRNLTLVFGIVFTIMLPIISIIRQRHVKRYKRICNLYCYGQWEHALKEIKIHRKFTRFPDHEHDLDFREATILAKIGKLRQALQLAEKWKDEFEIKNPGYFEARLSSVYEAAYNNEKVLELMRECYTKSIDKSLAVIDLAFKEALFGSNDKELELIGNINQETLSVIAKPYPTFILGIIHKNNSNYKQSSAYLESELVRFLKRQGEVLAELTIALCSGELAVVYHKLGRTKEAVELVNKVTAVLKAHGHQSLLDEIKTFTKI